MRRVELPENGINDSVTSLDPNFSVEKHAEAKSGPENDMVVSDITC